MKNKKQKFAYNLFVYPRGFIRGFEVNTEKDREEFKNSPEWYEYLTGGYRRGTFLDHTLAEKILTQKQDLYALMEGYYEYALIEKINLDEIDAWNIDVDAERWYKWTDEVSAYARIEKPEALKGTVNFT